MRRVFLGSALLGWALSAWAGEAKTLLFVDDHDIFYRSGTERILHPPKKYAGNPVVPADKPWEITLSYNSVHRDPATGRYQMWYQALTQLKPAEATAVCYAESEDGITWRKPEFDLFPFGEQAKTNIVFAGTKGRYGASVLFDARDPDAARRYKMAYWEMIEEGGKKTMGLSVAFSPDGIHWTKHPDFLLVRGSFGKPGPVPLADDLAEVTSAHTSVSDVIDAIYDPAREVYAIYAKTWIDSPEGHTIWKRAIVRTESKDFLHWSRPQLVIVPDEFDGTGVEYRPPVGEVNKTRRGVQLHGGPVFWHEGIYFSLLQVMDGETTGEMPAELATSRDGFAWQRPWRKEPFIPVTRKDTDFDGGVIWSSCTPVMLKDEMRFYYGAYAGLWKGTLIKSPTGIGLATLPLNRFAGLRPIAKAGQITLKPLDLQDCQTLTLNSDASGGSARVEVLNDEGYRMPGFTRDDAVPITGDSLRHEIAWKDKTLGDLPPGRYMLRIHLENAEAFALTLDQAGS